MKLFLIRHGETVDNVAQLYAGTRDSALTNHGVLQAERLGQYLVKRELQFTHFFSSDLQRANKTAKAIRHCQLQKTGEKLLVKRLEVLREQDFGFYEGKPFYARPTGSKKSGKEHHRLEHSDELGFQDVESKDSMNTRADTLVHEHLLPIICKGADSKEPVVAVVSHGIILNHLWRSVLKLFAQRTVSLAPGVSIGGANGGTLEHLGGWSNTGYLELDIRPVMTGKEPAIRLSMVIRAVNGKEHLQGLKRARGVASGKHDEGQKKIDGFFKKGKVG